MRRLTFVRAHLPLHLVHFLEHRRQHVGEPEHRQDPGDPGDASLEGPDPRDRREGTGQDPDDEPDDDQQEEDRDHQPEERRLDHGLEAEAGPDREHQRQDREQHAVDQALAEQDRAGPRLGAPQQPDGQPRGNQADDEHPQLDKRAGLAQGRDDGVEIRAIEHPRRHQPRLPGAGRRLTPRSAPAGARRRCAPGRRGCSRPRGRRRSGRGRASPPPP